nr:MAG TPA: hypothetical protein [Caudoviricetes sp.]
MAKTGKQIEGDIYNFLRNSTLFSMISGAVYRAENRPRDSRLEDAVVRFTAGLPNQIQTGVVTINIFIPDIDPYNNGVFVEDSKRAEFLEQHAAKWVDSLSAAISCYKFKLQQTICTIADTAIKQHFIAIKLGYSYFDNDI